jgi:hypothetical protein
MAETVEYMAVAAILRSMGYSSTDKLARACVVAGNYQQAGWPVGKDRLFRNFQEAAHRVAVMENTGELQTIMVFLAQMGLSPEELAKALAAGEEKAIWRDYRQGQGFEGLDKYLTN